MADRVLLDRVPPDAPDSDLELHHKTVSVVTASGIPVSMGRIRVHPSSSRAAPRIDVVFHTENVSCAITVERSALQPLSVDVDGIHFRYTLPPGEELWSAAFGPKHSDLDAASASVATPASAPSEAHIETFPLPPESRLTGYSATQPPKTDGSNPQGRDRKSR